jgi:hypothetical protein
MSLVEYLVPFVSGGLTVVGVKLVGMNCIYCLLPALHYLHSLFLALLRGA